MEYGDVYFSDDGTRAVRWISIEDIPSADFRCEDCALFDETCDIPKIEGWTKLAIEAEARRTARGRSRCQVCVDGMFVELDPLEAELHKIGGG